MRHSDDNLSEKIDLENPKYKLIFKQTTNEGVRIDVKVNRVPRPSNSKIRRKDELEISWSKQFCKTLTKSGKWNEISSEFIDVNSSSGTVTVKEILPPDDIKTINFNLKDWNGNSVYGANLICKNAGNEKPVVNNKQITFKGEDLGKRWTVSASNDRFFSEDKQIDFEKDCLGDTGSIDIVLEKVKLTIIAREGKKDGDIIDKYKVSTSNTEFIGNEIEKTHTITVSSSGFESTSFYYCPEKDVSLFHIPLQKKQPSSEMKSGHQYIASVGNQGTWKDGSTNDRFSKWSDASDLEDFISPAKGYKFIKFIPKGNNLIAQYEKKVYFYQSPKFIVGSIVGAIVIGFGIWAFGHFFWRNQPNQPQPPQQTDIQQIKYYIEGNSLILDTLNSYKETLDKGQTEGLNSLDSAIKKREFINNWNFDTLKKLHYYSAQQKFKTAIEKIDSTRYNAVKESLGNVSTLSLDQIADSIKKVLNTAKPVDKIPIEKRKQEEEIQRQKEVTERQRKDIEEQTNKSEEEKKKLVKDEGGKGPFSATPKLNNPKDITKELQSGTVTRNELENWKTARMDKFKKSLDLYLEFWASIKTDMQKKDSEQLLRKINADKLLQKSELQSFLKSVCASTVSFDKYKDTPGKKGCNTLNELRNKVK